MVKWDRFHWNASSPAFIQPAHNCPQSYLHLSLFLHFEVTLSSHPATYSQGISGKYLVCKGWDVGRRGGWRYQVVRWSGTCQRAVILVLLVLVLRVLLVLVLLVLLVGGQSCKLSAKHQAGEREETSHWPGLIIQGSHSVKVVACIHCKAKDENMID